MEIDDKHQPSNMISNVGAINDAQNNMDINLKNININFEKDKVNNKKIKYCTPEQIEKYIKKVLIKKIVLQI